jgi:Protein of unknown function (DUF1549)/Protein of unknown function (DUF1553)/Planctomycete cytochrome C
MDRMMRRCRFWITCLCCLCPAAAHPAEPVDFQRQIRPILAQNCLTCHGADKQRGGLRLDSAAAVREGGNSGPAIVPGKAAQSRLIQAVTGSTPDVAHMPPKGKNLDETHISLLRRWIDAGAVDEAEGGGSAESAAALLVGVPPSALRAAPLPKHWAFRPIRRPPLPEVKDQSWVRNPIDAFILARLEKEGIKPSVEADKVTLIRRLSLDLLGLPPTPEEVDAFLKDSSADAYDKLVERLLASPHYGERWGRHWLDAARYADSNGFNIDAPRSIWKYRDWVIDALNRDFPFDRFTIEQLAGDLLPKPTQQQLIATGFHRNTLINQEGGIDVEQFRVESIVDRVNTTGSVWLGLTVGCAQCHDHKFDPISQREYYELFAFFNNCDEPNLELLTPEVQRQRERVRAQLGKVELLLRSLDPTTPERIEKWERSITDATRPMVAKEVLAVFDVAPNGRNAKQVRTLETAFRRADETRHVVGGLGDPLSAALHAHLLTTRVRLQKEYDRIKKQEPVVLTTMVLRERPQPRMTTVHLGGDFLRKGVRVQPGTPAVLSVPAAPPSAGGRFTRFDLARWLVSSDNPLTARVIMNRFWGIYFGTGIVETDNDFGTQGTPPSHPELLDWLASEFISPSLLLRDKGGQSAGDAWSMKHMHRLIVTSATYRQLSRTRPELAVKDPRNRLLARQTRMRLEAEIVRDVSLSASGLLSPKVGGPGVFPPQPDGVYRFTQIQRDWKPSAGAERYRRGLYTYFWRSAPHPALATFDAPDSTTTCTRRNRSNTPLQALTLLNDAGFYEYAQGLADRVLREEHGDDTARLRHAFRLCVARQPGESELLRLQAFLAAQKADLAGTPDEARQLAGNAPNAVERAAWVMTARVLLNLDEFITRE